MGLRMDPRKLAMLQGADAPLPGENDTSGMGLDPSAPMDYGAIAQRIRGVQGPDQDALRQQIVAGLGAQNKILEQAPQVDLSPLMALTDAWTGSQMAKSYHKPDSDLQREAALAKISDQVSKSGKALSDNEINLLKTAINAESNRQIFGLKSGAQAAAGASKKDDKEEQDINEEVTKLSVRTQPAAGVIRKLKDLHADMSKATTDEDGRTLPPGFGGIIERGAGKMGMDAALSPEAKKMWQDARGLVSATLQLQSGQAVPESEVVRKMQEFGMSLGSSPNQFVDGMENARAFAAQTLREINAGYRPAAVSRYKQRKGTTAEDLDKYSFKHFNMSRQEKIDALHGGE